MLDEPHQWPLDIQARFQLLTILRGLAQVRHNPALVTHQFDAIIQISRCRAVADKGPWQERPRQRAAAGTAPLSRPVRPRPCKVCTAGRFHQVLAGGKLLKLFCKN